jgi:hypothetical protein
MKRKTNRSQRTEEVMTKGVLEDGPFADAKGFLETLHNLKINPIPLRRGK